MRLRFAFEGEVLGITRSRLTTLLRPNNNLSKVLQLTIWVWMCVDQEARVVNPALGRAGADSGSIMFITCRGMIQPKTASCYCQLPGGLLWSRIA